MLILANLSFVAFKTPPVKANSRIIEADSTIIYVPENYSTIQEAVNAAGPGDTIQVAAGMYHETVFVNKSLTLIGENPNTTIINGFSLAGSVVTINASNVKISGFTIGNGTSHGVELVYASNCTISGNVVTENSNSGIFLNHSSTNTISGNVVSNNKYSGIYLREYCSNNFVADNRILNSDFYDILVYYYCSSNVITGNVISGNGYEGIRMWWDSTNNVISNNTVSHHTRFGIDVLFGSGNNTVSGNTVSDNYEGIKVDSSVGTILRNNNMTGNTYNFDVEATSLSEYTQNIDTSNTVNGKPIYYWVNQHNKQVPSNAGYVGLVSSTNIVVKDLNLSENEQGVILAGSSSCTVTNVNTSNNEIGLILYDSGDNSIFGNTIINSTGYGVYLEESSGNAIYFNNFNKISYSSLGSSLYSGIFVYSMSNNNSINYNVVANSSVGIELNFECSNNSINGNIFANDSIGIELSYAGGNIITSNTVKTNDCGVFSEWCNNTLYHNNFINNLSQANVSVSVNIWDNGYPSGGNYWSDYQARYPNAAEIDGSGIWNMGYVIDANNIDHYPLMYPLQHDVAVLSVTPSPTEVTIGESVTITVVVKNNGSYTESFNVTAYANTTAIGMQTVTNLAAGANQTLTFTWDTKGVAAGSYTIKADAPLAGDISPGDNEYIDGQVKLETPTVSWLWLWIVIGVVIVIIIVAAVAYMLTRRKPAQPAK
jgi:parallel beta-helix repeat protein